MINLTSEDKKKIEEAVIRAEKKTTGEIVPVILRQSDPYPGAHLRCGVFVAFLAAFVLYVVFPYVDPLWYILAMLPALVFGFLLARLSIIKRLFLNKNELKEEVHQKALEAFHYLDLYSTKDRTGVLIFISLLEHRVEILADKGINTRLPADTWEHLLNPLIVNIKSGKMTDGLVETISKVGDLLAEHFPKTADNQDELPNRVIIDI